MRSLVLGLVTVAIGLAVVVALTLRQPSLGPRNSDEKESVQRTRQAGLLQGPKLPIPAAPSGFVIDQNGQAVAGVQVSFVDPKTSEVGTDVFTTDSQGAFYLPKDQEGPQNLAIVGDAILPARVVVQPNTAPHIMVSRRGSVTVRVVNDAGIVANAKVRLLTGYDVMGSVTTTDAHGLASFSELPLGPYQVVASHNGQVSDLVAVVAGILESADEPDTISLYAGTRVLGRTHSANLGVAAALRFVPLGHEHAVFFAQADARGDFELPALPHGRWRIEATHGEFAQGKSLTVSVARSQSFLTIPMTPMGHGRIRITTKDGTPIAGARIRTTPLSKQGVSFANAAIDSSRKSNLRWVHPLAGPRQMPIRDERRFGAKRDGVRPPECGRGHCGVDLGGVRGAPVVAAADGTVVTIVDEDKGRAGRYVTIEHSGGQKTFYMHLDQVEAALTVGQSIGAGTPLGTLGRSGIQRSLPHLHFALSFVLDGQAHFVDPEPMLQYAIVLPQVTATANATLPASFVRAEALAFAARPANVSTTAQGTDEVGELLVGPLAPGTYTIVATHPDYAPAKAQRLRIRPGSSPRLATVILQPGVRLSGYVTGPDGPIANPWIRVTQGQGESQIERGLVHGDSDGQFTLPPYTDEVELEAGAPGYGTAKQRVRLNDAGATIQLVLSRFDATLRGQVRDPTNLPMANAVVQIADGPGGRGRRTTCDDTGFFRVPNLPDGIYTVRVVTGAYPAMEATIEAERDETIKLEEGGGFRLQIRDADNEAPLAGARVVATGPNQQKTSMPSDKGGEAQFTALVPGTWKIEVSYAERVTVSKKIEVSKESGPMPTGKSHVVALSRGAILAGILRDSQGDRVEGVRIWLKGTETVTDSDGRFRLAPVATGDVVLRADTDKETLKMALTLFPGDEIVTLEPRLVESARAEDDEGEDEEQYSSDE